MVMTIMKEKTEFFTGKLATKLPPPFKAYYGDEKSVFVSYAHKDSEVVFPILDMLNTKGIRLWYDEGLQAGKDWFDFMRKKILKCTGFLVFLSPYFLASPHAMKELRFAYDEKKQIVGVLYDGSEIPPELKPIFQKDIGIVIKINDPERNALLINELSKMIK